MREGKSEPKPGAGKAQDAMVEAKRRHEALEQAVAEDAQAVADLIETNLALLKTQAGERLEARRKRLGPRRAHRRGRRARRRGDDAAMALGVSEGQARRRPALRRRPAAAAQRGTGWRLGGARRAAQARPTTEGPKPATAPRWEPGTVAVAEHPPMIETLAGPGAA